MNPTRRMRAAVLALCVTAMSGAAAAQTGDLGASARVAVGAVERRYVNRGGRDSIEGFVEQTGYQSSPTRTSAHVEVSWTY